MSTRYVPCTSAENGDAMSRHLYDLSRPPGVKQPGETEFLFARCMDAAGVTWLEVVTDYVIPVHVDAELDGIGPLLAGVGISQAEIDDLDALIQSKRGSTMTPWDYFPAALKAASKTFDEITWPERA